MKQFYLPGLLFITICSVLGAQQRYRSYDAFKYSAPGLKEIGVLATRHAKDIESSPWSVGCETLDRDYADFQKYKSFVGELGVKHGRLQSGWAKCEKVKGEYDFEWLDKSVYGLAEQSVQPWITICYGNPLYDSGYRLGAPLFTDESTMEAWLSYVEALVIRYQDVVTEWEIWNEPQIHGDGGPVYAELFIRTASVIKKIQPEAKVIGFASLGIPLSAIQKVLDIIAKEDALGLLDYVSYHPYTHNPDDSYADVRKLKELVHSYSPRIGLFQGENGCPSQLEWAHALADYPWTEISQAKWISRRMAGDRILGIRTSIFTIIDLQYYNMLQSFGLIRSNALHDIIYKRPSYHAVQHMVSFFDDTVVPVGILDHETNAYRKLTVAGFMKGNFPVALIWYNDRIPGDEIKWDPVNLTISNMELSDPVYVEMVSGKVFELNPEDWKNKEGNIILKHFPVWDSVMMLTERAALRVLP